MKNTIVIYIHSKSSTFQNLLCAFFVTSIFSMRWINCLPFSGYMPVANNTDQLDIWARYLIYAKEPFGFPIGVINGMCFPFSDASITRGPMPLFAILFKLLSKIYTPFSEFYYFVLVELLFVFLVAYFTCLLLESFKTTSSWLKLIGAVLVSLSFPFLYRSSNYYAVTYQMTYFPLYLAFAYFYVRTYKHPCLKSQVLLTAFLPICAFFDYYTLFAVLFMFAVSLCLSLFNYILNQSKLNRDRIISSASVFILGVILVFTVTFIVGKEGDLTVPPGRSPLTARYSERWGYGGGFGGGFHVADVLTLVIPPKDADESVPLYRRCGPSSYLSKLGFTITTNDLQDGQYEGFTYLGTTTIGILFVLLIIKGLSPLQNYRIYFMKLRLTLTSKIFLVNDLFSLPIIIGVSTFMLYIISWGYIIHIGGIRLNNIPTPSLIMALVWPKFMFARSLGRLAIPFMLYITIGVIMGLDRYLYRYMYQGSKCRRVVFVSIMIFLVITHIYEIRGYLEPSEVTYGNEIASVFSKEEAVLVKRLLQDKRALMIAPDIRSGDGPLFKHPNWLKTCYSLAFHSNIPISGIYSGMAIPPEHRKQTNLDIKYILAGNIKEIVNRYGDVAIAAPSDMAKEILRKTNISLKYYELQSQNVTILTLDE